MKHEDLPQKIIGCTYQLYNTMEFNRTMHFLKILKLRYARYESNSSCHSDQAICIDSRLVPWQSEERLDTGYQCCIPSDRWCVWRIKCRLLKRHDFHCSGTAGQRPHIALTQRLKPRAYFCCRLTRRISASFRMITWRLA